MNDPKDKDNEIQSVVPHPEEIGEAMSEITDLLYQDLDRMMEESGMRDSEED